MIWREGGSKLCGQPEGDAAVPVPRRHDHRSVPPVLTIRDAVAQRGATQLWSGLDLTVAAGEFVAVLGPNGVGKSTLLQVILGMVPLLRGEAAVLGKRPGQANQRIGYLPQRRSFDPSLRVRGRDIVRLGVDGHRWGIPLPAWWPHRSRRQSAHALVQEAIDLVGAAAYADRPIGELSGGEQQRLLIAQALAARPELLLLDEPLESLDLPNQAAIAALIARISRVHRVAVIMVTHDINPVLSVVDTVVYLAPGGSKIGPPHEVITGAVLSELFGTPVEVLNAADGRLVVVGHPERCDSHPAYQP